MNPRTAFPRDSQLRSLQALDNSLKRERRVFLLVISLLIFAIVCAASAILAIRLANMLSFEEQAARAAAEEVNAMLIQRYGMLTTARLLLELHEQDLLTTPSEHVTHPQCTPVFAAQPERTSLRSICDEAVQLLTAMGTAPPLEFMVVDGSAAFGYQLVAGAPPHNAQHYGYAPGLLVRAVLAVMEQRGLGPHDDKKGRGIIWFPALPSLGLKPQLMLGATVVWKGDQPQTIVLTSIDPSEFMLTSAADLLNLTPSLVSADGSLLVGDISPETARVMNTRIAKRSPGRFHWLPDYGWALSLPPLAFGVGHLMFALPWSEQIYLMRTDLAIVIFVMVLLVGLLIAVSRYWNHRFLTRTYADASRALEGELLNYLLVHATPVGLSIVRQHDLKIILANQIARKVLGLNDSATRLPEGLCEEFARRSMEPMLPKGMAQVSQFLFSIARSDASSVHLEITYARAVLNREGVLFCAIADVTEQHKAEQLLREAKLTSEAVAKAKVSFFASMSHEIRTPLASLLGNLELLALGPLAPEQEARTHAMQMSATSLLHVVNDVLDFSRMDLDELQLTENWYSVKEFLERIVLAHVPLALRQGLKFYIVIDRNVPSEALFDQIRVAQILNNLLSNAFKFTNSGKIVIRVYWVHEALEIHVMDSGQGIPDDLKERLFQPFTQGEGQSLSRTPGTGLGLSICARLCKLMGGHIGFESTVGVGTHIDVTLPLRTSDDRGSGAVEWTLPERRPAILCRAIENQEWLTSLFDPQTSAPVLLSVPSKPLPVGSFDYLLATDEFTPEDVLKAGAALSNVVWVAQNGPMVPVMREDGSVEVSIYRVSGIRAATQMLHAQPANAGRATEYAHIRPETHHSEWLKVLIVEDNLLNRGVLRDQLRTLGANVIEAENGQEALARLEKEHVDIVLADINMPVMNGYELMRAAREKYPSLPVYAVSANARPEDVAHGREQGFIDYLSKPTPLAALAAILEAVAGPDRAARDEPGPEAPIPHFPNVPQSCCQVFIEQVDHDLADLSNIVETQDVSQLKDWAHRLSGGLVVLGPSMLLEVCEELRTVLDADEEWSEEAKALSVVIAEDLLEMRRYIDGQVTGQGDSA
ncbi:hybrid sensor histidine kinase/response regulator [Paraburkholderia sp. RAU2J]|uniref:hybrid sensor histidine kinase/response regulator n=1 Tax=Paraburkholderia sp. RAU2J TaxID=1938810 RepID=UPI000EAEB575|nr:hybrid sensor histidine kinase/response regulator [Paraburkholderia sp. RAU2J]